MSTVGSIANTYLNFMVGGGNGIVTDSIRHAVNNHKMNNQSYIKAIYTGTCDGFVRSHLRNKKNGGFFTSFWQNTKDAFKEFRIEKSPIKTGKNLFRGFSKAIPLALAVYGTISGIPNIYRAFRDEGIKAGLKETIKTAGKLTTAALLSTLAGGLIKIPRLPFLGSLSAIIGSSYTYMIGEQIGDRIGDKAADLIFGKSYTEKMKELQKQQEKIAKQQEKETLKEMKKIAKEEAKLTKNKPKKLDIMSYIE